MVIEARNQLYAIVQEMLAQHHQGLTDEDRAGQILTCATWELAHGGGRHIFFDT